MYIQQKYQPHPYASSLLVSGSYSAAPKTILNQSQDQGTSKVNITPQLVQVTSSSVFNQSNPMAQKLTESLRNSQQLPLKFVAQPSSILSKQAIDLKDSLEKLKQFSTRKVVKQQEQQQSIIDDVQRRGTFGKEKERIAQFDKTMSSQNDKSASSFKLIPVSNTQSTQPQQPPKSQQGSNQKPKQKSIQMAFEGESVSPIKFYVTQQDDSDIPKLYHYQESNDSATSQDDKVINIYTSNPYDADYIVKSRSIRVQSEDKKEIERYEEEQIIISQDIIHEEEHQSEISVDDSKRQTKSYSKMTPEEANSAYQGRKKEIKSHLDQAKQAQKYKGSKLQNSNLFVKKQQPKISKLQELQDRSASPKQVEVIDIIRSAKRVKSRKYTPAQSPHSRDEKEAHFSARDFSLFSDKKSNLLNDIKSIDREIKQIENMLTTENSQANELFQQTFNQANKSLDNQIKGISNNNYQHRAEHLYQQGQLRNEKKNLIQSWTRAQQSQKELKECTFKPQQLSKAPPKQNIEKSQNSTFKLRNSKEAAEQSNLFLDRSIMNKSSQQKSPSQIDMLFKPKKSNSQSKNQNVIRSSSSIKSQTALFEQKKSYESNKKPLKNNGGYQTTPQPQFLEQIRPVEVIDKVNAVTQKYQLILDQANKLKTQMGLL